MPKVNYILIRNSDNFEGPRIDYFESIDGVTNFMNQEKLLPSDVNVYEVSKEVHFKVVPVVDCVQKDGVDKQA